MATGKNCPHGFKQQSGSVMFRSRIIGGEMGSWRVPDSVKMTDETFLYIKKKKKKVHVDPYFQKSNTSREIFMLNSAPSHPKRKNKTKQKTN